MRKPAMVYIAGPIGKNEAAWEQNLFNARNVGAELIKIGFVVYVPHFGIVWPEARAFMGYADWLEYDKAILSRCDAVFRMHGESSGSDQEVLYAATISVPVFSSLGTIARAFGLSYVR